METTHNSANQNLNINLANIIAMNTSNAYDDEIEDYDFDTNPDDFFYELQII